MFIDIICRCLLLVQRFVALVKCGVFISYTSRSKHGDQSSDATLAFVHDGELCAAALRTPHFSETRFITDSKTPGSVRPFLRPTGGTGNDFTAPTLKMVDPTLQSLDLIDNAGSRHTIHPGDVISVNRITKRHLHAHGEQ